MQLIKNLVRAIAQRSGYKIVRSDSFGTNHFFDIGHLLREKTAPVVFDVGANRGQSAIKLRQLLSKAAIYSFEPSPATFRELEKNCQHLAGWQGFNVGIGASNQTLSFSENSHADMSSFLKPSVSAWGDVVRTTEVPVVTLDSIADQHGIGHVDLLKTDTQGYDLEVLKGASRLLGENRIGLVFCELIFSDMYSGQPRFSTIVDHLLDRNFELVGFYDMHYRNERIGWTDALFINKAFGQATGRI